MGVCMRRCSSSFKARSLACCLWRIVCRRTVKCPIRGNVSAVPVNPSEPFSKNAEYHQCHIVVLGSASSERLHGGQDPGHYFKSRKPVPGFGYLDQSIFAPLLV